MENNNLQSALMKRYNVQEFMGGGTASHTMPDGTVMPGATHEDYEAMGYQEGGAAMPVSIPQDDNQFLFDALQAAKGQMSSQEADAVMQMAQPMDPAMEL